jgi:3'(2'), 5'-bisphosphate nucleotidase
LWTAAKGGGAWLNGCRLPLLTKNARLNLIDNYPEPRHFAQKVSSSMTISKYIECGSLGLKSCLVVDNTADLFVKDVTIRDWDIAPIAVMIEEVGGVLCDLNGRSINFTGRFDKECGLIVARDQDIADRVVKIASSKL